MKVQDSYTDIELKPKEANVKINDIENSKLATEKK